ncbi:MAG TPA: ComEC/Rec2 family competence protein [Candidatus Wunengus sp. YC60]|uniref:ComEC/Rec2 family competence protein n=1 Tax=Candidatus Wunengus sp. YC60 TaxID=3367697 RepID=UPI004026A269
MDIITVNVGQGAFAIVRHNSEAIIVDACMPPSDDDTVVYLKGVLAAFLKNHSVTGFVLTGFDEDHSAAMGVGLILKKYRPNWIMYPKYYKDTDEAKNVFQIITQQENERANSSSPLKRMSVRLDKISSRNLLGLSQNFEFELFSPHIEDMDSSNNSSIVLRVVGKGVGGFSYLITGDTESDRWETINRLFANSLRSDVMAASHHGSKSGANAKTLILVSPNTILISAGVDNQYGHPDPSAVEAFQRVAKHVFSTNVKGGVSLVTSPIINDFETKLVK